MLKAKSKFSKPSVFILRVGFNFLLVLIFIGLPILPFANENISNKFEHLTAENGLSHNTVSAILQDHFGFMWFGTVGGLNRYDGYSFQVFEFDPDNPVSISSNLVRCLLEDSNGNIWVGTDQGLNRYNRNSGFFSVFKNAVHDSNSLSNNVIETLLEDSNGNIWIGTRGGGLIKISSEQKLNEEILFERIELKTEPGLLNDNIKTIFQDEINRLWIGTEDFLIVLQDLETNTQNSIKYFSFLDINNKAIMDISKGKEHSLLVSTFEGGVFEITYSLSIPTTIKVKQISILSNISNTFSSSISAGLLDTKGNVWICTRGSGISFISYDSGNENQQIIHNRNLSSSLSGNFINAIYEDRSGVIWVATDGRGINKYEPNIKPFKTITQRGNNSLPLENINEIIEDENGDLVIGTRGRGLFKYEFNNINEGDEFDGQLKKLDWIKTNNIRSVLIDNKGNYWIAGGNVGVQVYNKNGKLINQFIHDPNDANSLSHNYVFKIFQDSKGIIWIGSWGGSWGGGLDRFDPTTGKFINFSHNPQDSASLSENIVLSIFEDYMGQIWVGTKGAGLNLLSKNESGEYYFIRFKNIPGDKTSLNDDHITDIFLSKDSTLWVPTERGLNKFNFLEKNFTRVINYDRLSNKQVFGIQEDSNGILWLSKLKGLAKFNPITQDEIAFNESDGLNSFGYQKGIKLKNRAGLVFAGQGGVVLFNPNDIKVNRFVPPVVISNMQIFNIDYQNSENINLKLTVHTKEKITLPYEENNFSLQFAALSFVKQNKNKYAYRMDGFDDEGLWIFPEPGQRVVSYSNLREGEYAFKVKASNNDGIWNEEGKVLHITVLPPNTRTKWAYVFYFLFISSLFYLFVRLIIKSEEEKSRLILERLEHKKTEELNQMKLRFFTNISHEFRTPLALILAPIEKLSNSAAKLSESKRNEIYAGIKKNADRMLRLVNELMDFRKLDSGKLKLKAGKNNIVEFVKNIFLCFTEIAVERNISFSFNTSAENIQVYFDANRLEKVIFNLLSNSFKNSPDNSEISVTIDHRQTEFENNVLIKVCDKGKGIPEKDIPNIFERFYQIDIREGATVYHQQGTGIGLALAKSLIELHKGEIWVESKENESTCFTIKLPLGKQHLSSHEIIDSTNLSDSFTLTEQVEIIGSKEKTESTVSKPKRGKPKLLIVDDNQEIRSFLKNEYKGDYNIVEAENGKEGLQKANEENPNLIISDIMMPEMDGFEFCKKIKTTLITSHIPVILLTAKSNHESLIEGLETGADAYISKPFSLAVLEVRIRKLLEIRKSLQKLYSKTLEPDPQTLATNSLDQEFLTKAIQVIEENLDNPELTVDNLSEKMGMGKTRLYEKLKALTGKSSGDFIRSIRLKNAARMLKEGNLNVSQVSYSVGFSTVWYFSKCFKEEYNISPSYYRKQE